MKISSFIISSLMLLTSFVYAANLAPYLQVKKNSTKNTGITYTAVLPGEYEGDAPREFIITERGDNKLLESKEYTNNKYLLCDNKIYQVPELPESLKDMVLSVVVLSGDEKESMDEEFGKFKIPDYKEFSALNKETVNGYQCQVAEKVLDEKKMFDESNTQFTVQRVLKVYIIEKYGYPTRIERITRSKYAKETKWTSAVQEEDTINFVDFDTDISKKMLSLPKNAFVVDPTNKSMFDANAMKQQYLQKLKEQYADDED